MLAVIGKHDLPQYFEVLKVPHSLPKTKTKSCNLKIKKKNCKLVPGACI